MTEAKLDFSSTKDMEHLAKRLGTDIKGAKLALFWVMDFMSENVTQEILDCGAYYMPSYVGDSNLEKSFKEMVFAFHQQFGEEVKPDLCEGPWVHINHNGIQVSKDRLPKIEDVLGIKE